jgi:hypothetical protein
MFSTGATLAVAGTVAIPLAAGAAPATATVSGVLTATSATGAPANAMPCSRMAITAKSPAAAVIATGVVSKVAGNAAKCTYTITVPAGVAFTLFLQSYSPTVPPGDTQGNVPDTTDAVKALTPGQTLVVNLVGKSLASGGRSQS